MRVRSVALVRGINVGGRTLPMLALREICGDIGWSEVETYIQSGNVVFRAPGSGSRAKLEARLEEAIAGRFAFSVPVIVRSGEDWSRYLTDNPFPEASSEEPNRVLLAVFKAEPRSGAVEAIRQRAMDGERIEQRGYALWIHYASGVGTSKISPGALDRAVGSPVTTRNWRTVVRLAEMSGSSK